MKKYALVAGLVLAASLIAAPIAAAQDTAAPSAPVKAAICGHPSVDAITAEDDANVERLERDLAAAKAAVTAAAAAANKVDDRVLTERAAVTARAEELAAYYAVEANADRPTAKARLDARTAQLAALDAVPAAQTRLDKAKLDQATALKLEGDVRAFVGTRDFAAVKADLCTPPVTPAPTTTVTPAPPTTVAPPAGPLYPTCADAVAAGAAPIALGEPGYRPELDSDNDGVACDLATDTDPGDSGFSQVGVVPQGGVDTGTR